MSPLDIFSKPPDVWPEAFRQPAPSRRPYRYPDLFETVDGWVRQVIFRRLPLSGILPILDDVIYGAREDEPSPIDNLAISYAMTIRGYAQDGEEIIRQNVPKLREIYLRAYYEERS